MLFVIKHAIENNKSQPNRGDAVSGDTERYGQHGRGFYERHICKSMAITVQESGERHEELNIVLLIERNANYIFARRFYFPIISPSSPQSFNSTPTICPTRTGSNCRDGTKAPIEEERSMELRENLRVETKDNERFIGNLMVVSVRVLQLLPLFQLLKGKMLFTVIQCEACGGQTMSVPATDIVQWPRFLGSQRLGAANNDLMHLTPQFNERNSIALSGDEHVLVNKM